MASLSLFQTGERPSLGKRLAHNVPVSDNALEFEVGGSAPTFSDTGAFPAGDLNQTETVTIGADDPAEDVLATMIRYQVRRLPVIDGQTLQGRGPGCV